MLFTSTENGVEEVGGVVTGGRVKGGKVNEGGDTPPGETRTHYTVKHPLTSLVPRKRRGRAWYRFARDIAARRCCTNY